MDNIKKVVLLLLPLFLLCGCGGEIFHRFDLQDGHSLSIDARQRLVFVASRPDEEGAPHQIICTEPSPDAIVARAEAIAAQGSFFSRVMLGGGAANQESAASIGLRTQTIQLLRDGLFRACEAYMNGILDRSQYALILANFDRVMIAALAIDAIGGSIQAPAVAINSGSAAVQARAEGGPSEAGHAAAATAPQIGELRASTSRDIGQYGAKAIDSVLLYLGQGADPWRAYCVFAFTTEAAPRGRRLPDEVTRFCTTRLLAPIAAPASR